MSAELQAEVERLRDRAEEERLVDQLRVYQLEKLEKYRRKGHWENDSRYALLRLLRIEVNELEEALVEGKPAVEVARESADVANIAAMIADVVRRKEREAR